MVCKCRLSSILLRCAT